MKIFLGAVALLSSLVLSGCGSDGASPEAIVKRNGFDYSAMLENMADNIILPAYENAANNAAELAEGIQAYCLAIESNAKSEQKTLAQNHWVKTMQSWQQAELMWVGPLAENANTLRNRIYSYATNNRASSCSVDVGAAIFDEEFTVSSRDNNSRGLGALEYLLFSDSLDHTCSDLVTATQPWNARPDSERELARCNLALAIADDVADKTRELAAHWSAEGDNYRTLFLNRDNASLHLSQLSDALFYLEKEVKDTKLALPFSLIEGCVNDACPSTAEFRYASVNATMIATNIETFKTLFTGAEGLGFDDIFAFEGQAPLAEKFIKNMDAAIEMAQSLENTSLVEAAQIQRENTLKTQCLNESVDAQNTQATFQDIQAAPQDIQTTSQAINTEASYCRLHGLVRRLTEQLRTDFVTIVQVDLPNRASGDND